MYLAMDYKKIIITPRCDWKTYKFVNFTELVCYWQIGTVEVTGNKVTVIGFSVLNFINIFLGKFSFVKRYILFCL